ncbi:MAG: DUF2207 domain-containing protein [Actinobacteria bacterium]|nr:DUF2207 domain-containing protein [Actinomycetota bacterium]
MTAALATTLLTAALALAPVLLGAAPARADVEDFGYDSWHVDYVVSLNDTGRARAEVTETLVARFPDFDQNRGIVRALPLRYEGAPAGPENIAVTDAQGGKVPFELEEDDGFRAILFYDDSYVHGVQSYVIRYTLPDVILAVDDGSGSPSRDEFYWDILPLERKQPIADFSARISFAPPLASDLIHASRCYTGAANSSDSCTIDGPSTHGGTASYTIPSTQIPAGSGVTVAIGLKPGSAAQPPERVPNFALDSLPSLLAGAGALSGVVGVAGVAGLRRRRKQFRGTVVAQYEVPPNLPPLLAGPIAEAKKPTLPAEFVHLAVGGAMRIEEGERAALGLGKPKISFRMLDPARAADPLDQRALRKIFGKNAQVGTEFELPKHDQGFGAKMQKLSAQGPTEARDRGYTTRERSGLARVCGIISLALLVPVAILLVLGASRGDGATFFFALLLGVPALILGFFGLSKHRVFTPLGAETREYLLGVREFIRVAGADRLRVLQSYTGAERHADGTVNVVNIYEKLLPYAMLFGLEKEWGKVLEVRYRESGIAAPLWYPAVGVHGLDHLDSTISGFTSSFTSSASYSSSSSGGSSGGGFSGGGGGGGFSGGR